MPVVVKRHIIAATSTLGSLSAMLALLFWTEPIAVRFWFAVKARRLLERTLPREQTLNESAVAA
jgi:hypothetical protein